MKLNALEQKLIAVARAAAPSDRVPYAFEQRIMARLAETSPLDLAALWARALWRAAAPCLVVALLCSAWLLWQNDAASADDFSQSFESAVLVMADQPQDAW
ncbi:MAG: hypothetical protein HZA90_17665 [Verrucomicrobia bacterium]|nr:hypothetical protein [Verrucomicrobiota bacterium]